MKRLLFVFAVVSGFLLMTAKPTMESKAPHDPMDVYTNQYYKAG